MQGPKESYSNLRKSQASSQLTSFFLTFTFLATSDGKRHYDLGGGKFTRLCVEVDFDNRRQALPMSQISNSDFSEVSFSKTLGGVYPKYDVLFLQSDLSHIFSRSPIFTLLSFTARARALDLDSKESINRSFQRKRNSSDLSFTSRTYGAS